MQLLIMEMQIQTLTTTTEILHDFSPFIRVLKDGSIERCKPVIKLPPRDDHRTGVRSKDLTISTGRPCNSLPIPARMFMPRIPDPNRKLPLLVYFHGGGFTLGSAFNPVYNRYVSSIAAKANALALSVEYRLAPEHPIPACHQDAWASLQWVGYHTDGNGPDPWLNQHADLDRVFLVGDSAGANIAHNAAVEACRNSPLGVTVAGLALVHPYFGGVDPKSDTLWFYLCPTNNGPEDLRFKPGPDEFGLIEKVKKVIIFVAEKDIYRDAGVWYYEELKRSGGWRGTVEIVESKEVGHVFHLHKPKTDQALHLMDKLTSFIHPTPLWNCKP